MGQRYWRAGHRINPRSLGTLRTRRTHDGGITYCGLHGTASTIGGTGIFTDLAAYGDPGCTGTRARQFYHRAGTSPSTALAYIGFEPSVGLRAWDCGTQYYGWTYGVGGVASIGLYGQWSGSNSCGFQGDQHAKFVKSGYSDVWIYTYW